MSDHTIEAKITSEIRADVIFRHTPGTPPFGDEPDWQDGIDVLHVSPIGIVGPITDEALKKLAEDWIANRGGYEACCRLATGRD